MSSVVKRIAFTGGPCGGKTTLFSYLSEKLQDVGVSTIFAPEVATFLITAGLQPWKLKPELIPAFQELILETQMLFENRIFRHAMEIRGGATQLVAFDRGCMDAKAYMDESDWNGLLERKQWQEVHLRDTRYEAVIHMVTAAEGAEAFYNLDNPARTESPSEARVLDAKTRAAWLGHPRFRAIDNSTDFNGKLKRALNEVRKALGIPAAVETERKYLVKNPVTLAAIPVPYRVIDIEQFYVHDDTNREVRVRRRSQRNAGAAYYKTIKFDTASALSRVEIEEQIAELDYYRSLTNQRRGFDPIYKQRVCFLWNYQYFELDVFRCPNRHSGLTVLEIELTEENDKVEIPAWLGQVEEVSDNAKYKNASLARNC